MSKLGDITGRELLDMLKDLDDEELDLPVHIGYDYGDRNHTQVAPGMNDLEVSYLNWSSYHGMHKTIEEGADEDDKAIIIS